MAEFIFWLCLLLPVYAYIGYPLLLTLQLWGLHWLRLHLAGAAFILSLCHWKARRPARG